LTAFWCKIALITLAVRFRAEGRCGGSLQISMSLDTSFKLIEFIIETKSYRVNMFLSNVITL
jgi:hypothetical protein